MSLQDGTQEPTLNAAQERVTPDELAKAVAAMEARRDAEARQQNATIPLGEAVRQLGLDATPEELLSEVRRQRAQRETPSPAPIRPNRKQDSPLPLFMGALLAMMLFFGCTTLFLRHALDAAQSPVAVDCVAPSENASDQPAQIAIDTTRPADEMASESTEAVEEVTETPDLPPVPDTDSETTFTPLANIQAEQDVNTDFDSLHDLANGKSQAAIRVAENSVWDDKLWTIFKKDGEIFVHCFAPPADAVRAINGRSTRVYASRHDSMIEVKLPMNAFKNAAFVDAPNMAGANVNK